MRQLKVKIGTDEERCLTYNIKSNSFLSFVNFLVLNTIPTLGDNHTQTRRGRYHTISFKNISKMELQVPESTCIVCIHEDLCFES